MGAGTSIVGEEAGMEGLSLGGVGGYARRVFTFLTLKGGSAVYGRENKGEGDILARVAKIFARNRGKRPQNILSQTLPS